MEQNSVMPLIMIWYTEERCNDVFFVMKRHLWESISPMITMFHEQHISECIGSDSHSSHFLKILHRSFLMDETITQTWLGGWLVNEVGSNHILISIELTMTILSRLNSNSNPSETRSLSPFHWYGNPSLLHIDFLSSKIFHDSLLAITLSSSSYRLLSSPSFWKSIGYPIPIVP